MTAFSYPSKFIGRICSRCGKNKGIDAFMGNKRCCEECLAYYRGNQRFAEVVKVYKEGHPDKVKKWSKTHYKKYKQKAAELYSQNKDSIKISDSYIAGQLCLGTCLNPEDLPAELIALKAAQLKLKRIILRKQR